MNEKRFLDMEAIIDAGYGGLHCQNSQNKRKGDCHRKPGFQEKEK